MPTAEIAQVLLEALKLAPRYLAAGGTFAGFLLLGSPQLLERLGVAQFAQDHRAALGLIFIASVALLAVSLAGWLIRFVVRWWRKRKLYVGMQERLQRLTEDEKQILRYYFVQQSRAKTLRVDDGVVQGLVAAGVIYRSASLGNLTEGFAHNISDLAWDYLHVHPHLLLGTTNTYRTDRDTRDW